MYIKLLSFFHINAENDNVYHFDCIGIEAVLALIKALMSE